jgi:hypothetical protein
MGSVLQKALSVLIKQEAFHPNPHSLERCLKKQFTLKSGENIPVIIPFFLPMPGS